MLADLLWRDLFPVALVLTPFRSKIKQQLLVSWSGLRGAASIVFSIMAYTATNDDLDTFHIIFMIVLFSNTASRLNASMDITKA